MKHLRAASIALAIAAAGVPQFAAAASAEMAFRPNQVTGAEITEAQQKAVDAGLQFLAARQRRDGSFIAYGDQGHAGVTALAGLAFMSAGNLPGRGKYAPQVQKCLEFVLASAQQSGLIVSDYTNGPMYGHGFCTVFLGEIYGMTGNEEIKEKLQRAVKLLQKSQNRDGGWRYQPVPYDADISVTIASIMGLRAARDAGIKVEKEVIDRAIQYVRRCQNADGGFSYQAGQGNSGFARTAAGVASLYYAGVFEGDELKRGLNFLRQYSRTPASADGDGYFFYGHYYACQAMFLAGGEHWAVYYPAIRDLLIARQHHLTGSWTGEAGDDYGTAMSLIILQMPNRYLPVFHGKGPGG